MERLSEGLYRNHLGAILEVKGPAIRFGLNTLSDDIWVAYAQSNGENFVVTAHSMTSAGYEPA